MELPTSQQVKQWLDEMKIGTDCTDEEHISMLALYGATVLKETMQELDNVGKT